MELTQKSCITKNHKNHRTVAQIKIGVSHFYIKVNIIQYPAITPYQLLYFNIGLTISNYINCRKGQFEM